MSFCTDCGYQREWCRCPMRRTDLMIVLVLFAVLLAWNIWLSARPPVTPGEQGYLVRPPAVRPVPPPRPPRARA